MTKPSERDLKIALGRQYIRLGIGNAWGDQNEEMEIARQIMQKYNITNEEMNTVCGMSEELEKIQQIENDSHLQGNVFVTCIHGKFYLSNYEMEIAEI